LFGPEVKMDYRLISTTERELWGKVWIGV